MPELDWRYGYPFALGLMSLSVIGLLFYYRKKGWIQKLSDDGRDAARAADEERRDRAAKG